MKKPQHKNRVARFIVFLFSIIALLASFYVIDLNRVDNEEPPIFAIPILSLKDGGTIYKIGIGYGVFEWSRITTIVENGIEVNGNLVGYEFVKYPECYSVITNKEREPKVRLVFKK